jgi:phosphatidylserine/phosphatidylglycerophosphate/cardiolipin synthase-like enzyme
VTTSPIDVLFLRDTRRGGQPRQARTVAAHLTQFVEAATSTLDIAIYDFRLSNTKVAGTVVTALSDAAARGVTVRLAYDAGKPTATTTKTFALMAADPAPPGTAQWVADHFGNSDVQIRAITAPSGQLMHSKYIVRDAHPGQSGTTRQPAVWTGSTNWTDDAWTLQENNIITVASAELAAAYRTDFDQLWASGSIKQTGADLGGSAAMGAGAVGWDFAPGGGAALDAALAGAITGATERVVLATMVLTSHTVLTALVKAVAAGVPVSGIYDGGQMGPIEREWAKYPSSAEVLANWKKIKPVLTAKKSAPYKPDSQHDFMHNKILIADDQLFTGSYNFSANAEKNAENQLRFAHDDSPVERYANYVDAIAAAYR